MSEKVATQKAVKTHGDLFKEFSEAVKLEIDGLGRFNEIEAEIKALQPGTPEFKTARKERVEMIRQVRSSRKTQKDLKVEIYNS